MATHVVTHHDGAEGLALVWFVGSLVCFSEFAAKRQVTAGHPRYGASQRYRVLISTSVMCLTVLFHVDINRKSVFSCVHLPPRG